MRRIKRSYITVFEIPWNTKTKQKTKRITLLASHELSSFLAQPHGTNTYLVAKAQIPSSCAKHKTARSAYFLSEAIEIWTHNIMRLQRDRSDRRADISNRDWGYQGEFLRQTGTPTKKGAECSNAPPHDATTSCSTYLSDPSTWDTKCAATNTDGFNRRCPCRVKHPSGCTCLCYVHWKKRFEVPHAGIASRTLRRSNLAESQRYQKYQRYHSLHDQISSPMQPFLRCYPAPSNRK